MRRLLFLTAIVISACYGLAGCGGNVSEPVGHDATASFAASGPQVESPQVLAAQEAEWQAILANPGVPGVDYDPQQLTVSYLPLAKAPAGLPAANLPAGQSAASMGNASLRKNKQYEAVTDAIAARFGLKIGPQVYVDGLNLTGFALPVGVDGAAVIAGIRREFTGVVQYATYSRLFHMEYTPNDPYYVSSSNTTGWEWDLHKIDCADAWDFTLGKETVKVAVLDTGVNLTHEELVGQLLGPDAFPSSNLNVADNSKDVTDTEGHGTFIAGQIVAIADNGRTIVGVAPGCRVIPIKISDSGNASDASIAAGMVLADELGAQVINLSWGGYTPDDALRQVVDYVYGKGRLFVAAAGNENTDAAHYPSDYIHALSVGSTAPNDARSSFSNYSAGVDIAAPGEGLKSSFIGGPSEYSPDNFSAGTSFAAPLVAGAAALLWSADAALTVQDIWTMLIDTGQPTSGFIHGTVPRLDIGAAMVVAGGVQVVAPQPGQLVYSGILTLTPQVLGQPDKIEAFIGGNLVETLSFAPWDFTLDTATVEFGTTAVNFTATKGPQTASDGVALLIDNSPARYPILENFQDNNQDFAGLDLKDYPESLLTSIKTIAGPGVNWTAANLRANGPATWNTSSSLNPYQGLGKCAYCGTGGSSYGAFETDALVSRKINLLGAANPTLVYYQRYNLTDGGSKEARGSVLVYDIAADSYTVATLNGGGQAMFSGSQTTYVKTEVDLSAFAGKQIRLVFLMESGAGAPPSGAAGWWVDNVAVVRDYLEEVPTVDSVDVPTGMAYGSVPDVSQLQVALVNPQRVVRATYILDLPPLGSIQLYDITLHVDTAPFDGVIDVPDLPNQLANLRIQYFDANNVQGPEIVIPVYIYNLRGDVNADNIVDQADVDALPAKIGLTSADTGYVPFYDCNLDGVINEADVAAVGYNWGASVP